MLSSPPTKTVLMIKLTFAWENEIKAAQKRKKDNYSELAAACLQAAWRALTFLVKVG